MFGGVSGDLLGATNEVAEIIFILIVPVVLFRRLEANWWWRAS
jgi:cobalamin synthase